MANSYERVALLFGFRSGREMKRATEAAADKLVAKYTRPDMDKLQTLLIALHYSHSHAASSISEVLRMRVAKALVRKGFKPPRGVLRVSFLPKVNE
jgi:hypothetical protein